MEHGSLSSRDQGCSALFLLLLASASPPSLNVSAALQEAGAPFVRTVDRSDPEDDRSGELKRPKPVPVPAGGTAAGKGPSARDEKAGDDEDDDEERRAPETEITVTAHRLDSARARIDPSLGAASYAISNDAVENRPGGETRTLGSVLLQAPGVTRDARGALIVRSQQGGVQYRLNGIILPTGAGDFGEALSARLAASTELLTGALPAQYGLAPAGVVNVTTKNGHYLVGGQAELYGGAHGTVEPAVEWSKAFGETSLFASGSYRRSSLGLPAPTRNDAPAHDASRELEGFAYVDHVIDDVSRVSVIVGSVNEHQQIPAIAVPGFADSQSRFGDIAGHNH